MTEIEEETYYFIEATANKNLLMQGISGAIGFPYTLLVDGLALFLYYEPMINKIRNNYSLSAINKEEFVNLIQSSGNELFYDLVIDKIVGNIPVVGVYANIVCAKILTWRLGLLFFYLSARNLELSKNNITVTLKFIRRMMNPNDIFLKLNTPQLNEMNSFLNSYFCELD